MSFSVRRLRLLPVAACLALVSPAVAQSFDYDIDPASSPFTFSGTSNVGPIVGTPNTFDLDGSFALLGIFSGPLISSARFTGGDAMTVPGTLTGEVPGLIPGIPLATLAVRDLRISANSTFFSIGTGGDFAATVTFTVIEGSVDFAPLIGAPGTVDITGLQSAPTSVTGTLSQSESEAALTFLLDTAIPFDEPSLGVNGTIDLMGTVHAGFRFYEPFCFGDGSGTACPCGNASPQGAEAGCLSSIGSGATLRASGLASVSSDTLQLQGAQMPATAPVLYFQGSAPFGSGAGMPFGDGLLCASGSVIRLGAKLNAGGASTFPTTGLSISTRGQIPSGGATRWYQGWYRNQAPEFCTADRFNLTNGLRITWVP